jgi:hypothetical protein
MTCRSTRTVDPLCGHLAEQRGCPVRRHSDVTDPTEHGGVRHPPEISAVIDLIVYGEAGGG